MQNMGGSGLALSDADFHEFFVAKANGSVRCPVCSTLPLTLNTVSDMGDPNGALVPARLTLPAGVEGDAPFASHPFYSVSCSNCGHTMFFHSAQIEQWLAAKAKAPENG